MAEKLKETTLDLKLNFISYHHFQISRLQLYLRTKNKFMFNQNVADGANLFVIILAIIIGFASALGYVDYLKEKKAEKKD
jgi:uncharacterized membrane protein YwzB